MRAPPRASSARSVRRSQKVWARRTLVGRWARPLSATGLPRRSPTDEGIRLREMISITIGRIGVVDGLKSELPVPTAGQDYRIGQDYWIGVGMSSNTFPIRFQQSQSRPIRIPQSSTPVQSCTPVPPLGPAIRT